MTVNEVLTNRFEANDVARAAGLADAFILRSTDDADYAQYGALPFVTRHTYHITLAKYRERFSEAWPAASTDTIEIGAAAPQPSHARSPATSTATPPQTAQAPVPGPTVNTGVIQRSTGLNKRGAP